MTALSKLLGAVSLWVLPTLWWVPVLFFLLGRSGRDALFGKPKILAEKLSHWLQSHPSWYAQIVAFVYAGLTPLPNDILTVSLGLAGYKYRIMVIPVLLGNIFLTSLVAFSVTLF